MKSYYKFLANKVNHILIAFCLGIVLSFSINAGITIGLSPVLGQTIRPEMVAEEVYKRLDFIPLGNEYTNKTSGETVAQNTLMLRFIRYHEYVKSRPLLYRFDWQLTFADYFDVNEPMSVNRYPGHRTLAQSPLESDREIITSFTRNQRNQLIDTLLAIYNPQAEETTPQPSIDNTNNPSEQRHQKPSLPQPGDAELLLPIE